MKKDPKVLWQAEKLKKQHRRLVVLNCKERDYINFIKLRVSNFFNIEQSELEGPKRFEYILFPRYISVKLINQLSEIKNEDVMYFVNRDRTTWFTTIDQVDQILKKKYYKNAYENLVKLCSKSEYRSFVANVKVNTELIYNFEVYKDISNQL